jgi:1-acyl-sn-glycerol-3-phosphate acyltransferase
MVVSAPPEPPQLSKFEETALALARMTNERQGFKRAQNVFLHRISRQWIRGAVNRRTYADGIDRLARLNPDRGVLLASNHRSFYDQFIALLGLYDGGVDWARELYFPCRANFFYTNPAGLLVNMLIGGGVMYPPVFRERNKASLNRDAVERLVKYLAKPGTLVGMHPEGRRNKGDDPYQLLKAMPGVGEVILRAKPIVIPLFIGGLGNDFLGEYRLNYRRDSHQTNPIILCFGEPVDYSEFTDKPVRAALSKRTSDKVLRAISALGDRERTLRQACRDGEIGADHPNWLINRSKSERGRIL